MKTEYWGTVPYREAWDRQTALFNELVRARACGESYENRLIFASIRMCIRWGGTARKQTCCCARNN